MNFFLRYIHPFQSSGLGSSVIWVSTHCGLVRNFIYYCYKSIPQLFLYFDFAEKIERTVQIEASTVEIEERGVKLRLTVVDTPGYGDAINSQDWCVYVL